MIETKSAFSSKLTYYADGLRSSRKVTKNNASSAALTYRYYYNGSNVQNETKATGTGTADIDDVILNTLGGAIGYGMYVIYRFVRYGGRDTVGAGVEENGSEKKERKE